MIDYQVVRGVKWIFDMIFSSDFLVISVSKVY